MGDLYLPLRGNLLGRWQIYYVSILLTKLHLSVISV